MKRIKAMLMVLFFGLLTSTFPSPALAFLCSMDPDSPPRSALRYVQVEWVCLIFCSAFKP